MDAAQLPPLIVREPIEGLVDLARSAREDSLPQVLEAVATAVMEICNFASLAFNVYRPAWDDYEVVLVRGGPEIEAALQGTRCDAADVAALLEREQQRLGGIYFIAAGEQVDMPHMYTPSISPGPAPDAWQAEDALIVTLSDTNGEPLGFLSVDEPSSGLRPTDAELRVLRAICDHAEHALESARRHRETAEVARMNAELVLITGQVVGAQTLPELTEIVCRPVIEHFGFERVAAYRQLTRGTLDLVLAFGWGEDPPLPPIPAERLEGLLVPERERAGTWLVPAAELFPELEGVRSARNGRGPRAWNDCCLIAPSRDAQGHVTGALMVEDPSDHLIPSDHRRNVLRLLAGQAGISRTSLEIRMMQERMLDLVLVREGPAALSRALAETVQAPVALLDWTGQPLARAAHEGRHVEIPTRELLARPERAGPRVPAIRPIELGGRVEGYLVACESERTEPWREMALEQGATSFALQLVMLANAEEVEHRLRGNLIDELLDSAAIDTEILRRRTRRLGQELDTLTGAIAVEPNVPTESFARYSGFTYLARTVRAALDEVGCPAIIAPRAGAVLALIGDPATGDLRRLGECVIQEAATRLGVSVAVGISRPVAEPSGLATAIREAQQSLRSALALPKLAAVALAGELELHELLLAAPRGDEVRRAAERLLAPLSEAGPRSGELLLTLAAYLEALGHLESAARSLGIHVNTLRNRVGRIEELLGRELRDARTRVDLQLALELVDRSAAHGGAAAASEPRASGAAAGEAA